MVQYGYILNCDHERKFYVNIEYFINIKYYVAEEINSISKISVYEPI